MTDFGRIALAKSAVKEVIGGLTFLDYFTVIAFSSTSRSVGATHPEFSSGLGTHLP